MIANSVEEFLKYTPIGRLIALDVGTKRIGIAITDDTRKIITPSETLHRLGNKKDIPYLLKFFMVKKVSGVIVCLPLSFKEEETKYSQFVRRFVDILSKDSKIPFIFQDERLSSFDAEDLMLDLVGSNKTKQVVDKISASYILEYFLNSIKF